MEVLVKFFSYYRLIAGREQITLSLPENATVASMVNELEHHIGDLSSKMAQTAFMVNQKQASPETPLKDKDEIYLLYLIGGG
ncbi:MAG: MoaD/ThiS family protein [Proteobacteria bacterium]|nr:MoaD/ThiS family protein [Pseudomonadota bacterium]MBU4472225.1 MoaD/ThiS family protein [Pseudomonadota bacterium]MCG2750434.1 MoaD/ThiS family protein [Desulfobacteraceae bacterium]